LYKLPHPRIGKRLLVGLVATALITSLPAWADKLADRAKEKRAAEAQRAELQQKLDALKRDIDKTESARSDAADALADSEAAISKANRALHELRTDQRDIEVRIAALSKEQDQLAQTIEEQQKRLSRLLREQYVSGNEDRMKLLLSGDNPNRVNRELQYMGYVSQAQAQLIDSLQENLQTIEASKEKTQQARNELEQVARQQRAQKARLEQEKTRRTALLAQLSTKLASQRKEAGNIQRNDQRLAGLVDRLSSLIEAQRKAEAAAREKRRQEHLAAAKARREAEKMSSRKTPSGNPDAIEDDEPPKLAQRNELTPERDVEGEGYGRAFGSLRGQLRLPVRGELISQFGKRGEGPASKGLFIRTNEGEEVKAVAAGQVVFAEWLRGFGNLIIIDHGHQYMTIYGNNQAVLKRAGDIVKGGDIIANAGNSGGSEQSGLYFEMRHRGNAFDPLGWIVKGSAR
jgi:septal ring factor EnvC (AmiA/AmiB activator)